MLLLNVRTVAFLSSMTTAIQSILWIVGYILYILAYSCKYDCKYFDSASNVLPTNFGSYYMWYLQGSNCTTSITWISEVRRYNADLLAVLFSLGLSFNSTLLATSISTFFNTDSAFLYWKHKIYAGVLLLVSLWDMILVVIVSLDMSPLMDKVHYRIDEKSPIKGPSVFALPYFSEVFTVIIILLSRLVLFWVFNIFFAMYLLLNKNNRNSGPKSAYNNDTLRSNLKENGFKIKRPVQVNDEAHYKSNEFTFQQGRLPRQNSEVPFDNIDDEVSRRWTASQGKALSFHSQPEVDDKYEDIPAFNQRNNGGIPGNNDRDAITPEAKLSSARDSSWKRTTFHDLSLEPLEKLSFADNQKISEPISLPTSEESTLEKPNRNFTNNIRNSFSRKPIIKPSFLEVQPAPVPQHIREGFAYIDKSSTENLFKVKLKHVEGSPLTIKDGTDTETSANSSQPSVPLRIEDDGGASPYRVVNISDLDPEYVPHGHLKPSSPLTLLDPPFKPKNSNKKQTLGPPPPPPTKNPSSIPSAVSLGFKNQMSLEEAIRTRRPLKPVIRSPIDTNC